MQTNAHTGTTIDEVAAGIYRINTLLRIDAIPGGFNLSQYWDRSAEVYRIRSLGRTIFGFEETVVG